MKMSTSEIIVCYLTVINIFYCQREDSFRNRAQVYRNSTEDIRSEDDYFSGESGASLTIPTPCSSLRKDGYVILEDRPCKIVKLSTPKTNKHGHAKVHIIGQDVFSGKEHEVICPSTHNIEVPVVTITDYQVTDLSDGYLMLQHDYGQIRSDIKVPEGKMGKSIQKAMDDNDNSLMVTVIKIMNQEAVVDFKLERAK